MVEEFLAHHGVKGMKWGVRKRDDSGGGSGGGKQKKPANFPLRKITTKTPEGAGLRAESKMKFKQGTGDLGNAHLAALKTKGHRTLNAFLGDKTYWKRAAIIAGVGLAGLTVSVAVPGLLPAATLGWIGTHVGNATAIANGLHLTAGSASTAAMNAAVGKSVMTGIGTGLTQVGVSGASIANKVSNTVRAVRGNARIEKSFSQMGKHLWDDQRTGSKQVQKVLKRNGSLSGRKLRHGMDDDQFLAHADSGNTDAVIVALPRALDPVRLIGNEDKHATLLYFGPTASLPEDAKENLLETLAQASAMFMPFAEGTMGVERLGSDVPPALVAMLTQRKLGMIRKAIQVNPLVGKYLKNATQHAEYKPHVTLDYPDWGGEPAIRKLAQPLYEVGFDRLALWWNDERFEVPLGPERMEPMDSMKMAEQVDDFLAHYGIKGMRWGIRRSDRALDKNAGRKPGTDNNGNDRSAKKAMDKMKTGSVVPMQQADGSTKIMIKKKDGSWKETYLSADSEKFLQTRGKEGHELSTREMKEALDRARKIEEYDSFFLDSPNKELAFKVEALKMQAELRKYQADLAPPSRAEKFKKTVGNLYGAYKTIDEFSGGQLSTKMHSNIGQIINPTVQNVKNAQASANAKASKPPKQPKPPKAKKFKAGKSGTPPPPFQGARPATFKPNPAFRPTMRVNADGSATPVYNITDLGKGYTPPKSDPSLLGLKQIESKRD
jgi:hypothetical protein